MNLHQLLEDRFGPYSPILRRTSLNPSPISGTNGGCRGATALPCGHAGRMPLPSGVLDRRSEMVGEACQFESPTRFENTLSCGLVSQGSSSWSSRNLANSLQAYLAPASRYRRHERIRRIVRKERLLADALATHSTKAAYRHAALCGGFCFIEPCGHARRMTLVPMRLEAAPWSLNLCNRDMSNELNDVKYVNTLNKITSNSMEVENPV